MNLDRRAFLQSLGVGAAGTLALGAGVRAAEAGGPTAPPTLPAFDAAAPAAYWRAVRAHFPLRDAPLYLNCGGLGPTPQPVLDVMFKTMLRLQEHSETGYVLIEPAREIVARFLGARADEICFVRNATEANSIVAAGLALRPGDEVIFESHAHPGGSFTWFNQAKERGVVVKLFDPDPAGPEANLALIRALITPRTKVIQVSHITCTTGLVFPVRAIAALARERGVWFHIDGAQAVGMIPVDLAAIGCDSYAVCGHKWLGGPHESGVFFLRRDRLEQVAVTGIGAHSGELPHLPGRLAYRAETARHEYGTRNAATMVALAEAVCFQERIGVARIAAHGRALATHLLTELAEIDGITVLTPRHEELRAAMTTITHARADGQKFFTYLLKAHGLRCRPVTEQKLDAVRISTHVFNSVADCERIVAAVRASAREL